MLVALNVQVVMTTCKDNHRRPFTFFTEDEGLSKSLPSLIEGATVLSSTAAQVSMFL